jgi:hypothetical protein
MVPPGLTHVPGKWGRGELARVYGRVPGLWGEVSLLARFDLQSEVNGKQAGGSGQHAAMQYLACFLDHTFITESLR